MKKVTFSLDLGANRPPSIKLTPGIETGPNHSLRILLDRKSKEYSDETVAIKMNGFDTRKGVFSMTNIENRTTHHTQINHLLIKNYRTFFLNMGEILCFQTRKHSILMYVKNTGTEYKIEYVITDSDSKKHTVEKIKVKITPVCDFDPSIKTGAIKDGDWSPTFGKIA